MAEYIERAVCLSILRAKANMAVLMDAAPYFEKAAQMLEKLPTADVSPVVHGHWVEYQIPPIICCSNCDWATDVKEKNFQYCPNCGAKMNEKEAVYD